MHAQVSAALRKKWGSSAFETFGAPISVSSLAQGYLSFGIVSVLHDHALGNRCTVAELEAVSDYWGHITYLFGVPEHLIPGTAEQMLDLSDSVAAHVGSPSPWTSEIAPILLDVLGETMMQDIGLDTWWSRRLLGTMSRHVLMPVMLGHMTHMFGPEVVRTMLANTHYHAIDLDRWTLIGAAAARAAVGASRLHHAIRSLGGWRAEPAPPVDPLLKALHTRYRAHAQRVQNLGEATYTGHDDTHTRADDLSARTATP
jgi:hypothetical protein